MDLALDAENTDNYFVKLRQCIHRQEHVEARLFRIGILTQKVK